MISADKTALAARHISASLAVFSFSLKIGMNAAVSAPSPSSRRNRFGTVKASVNAPAMGQRYRLKASKDISGFAPEVQRIFKAMKIYGLIVADNGSDMYISGTYDTRWNNDVLNPAFSALTASDFEVIQLGYTPVDNTPPAPVRNLRFVRP